VLVVDGTVPVVDGSVPGLIQPMAAVAMITAAAVRSRTGVILVCMIFI
jgi:hypothetical protein